MKKLMSYTAAGALSILVASSIITPAYAWNPKGMITKSVQNVTANGTVLPADTADAAVAAKPGDILDYTIEVSNIAPAATNNYNDLAYTVVTDSLPAGVVLVANTSTRELKENMGTILPGKSKSVHYQVKVTSTTDGAVILNKACFTANSAINDRPQRGCNDAVVKVAVPPVVTPPAVVTPETPAQPAGQGAAPVTVAAQPAELPSVGASDFGMIGAAAAGIAGYLGSLIRAKRRMTA